jgi:hypothetical protein
MPESAPPIEVAFRIPGTWAGPQELVERLPADYHLTPEGVKLPDGTFVLFDATDADTQFANIFLSSCRQPPTAEELTTVNNYSVNVLLCGPGGSLAAARTMMQVAAAFVRAGGAGVFIDNCGLAHGGSLWLEMTADRSADALSFAFVSVVENKNESYTMGMHVLGLPEIVMKRSDAQADDFGIIDVLRYACESEKPLADGHILADLDGPRFQAYAEEGPPMPTDSPMHNPLGRLRLVSVQDIAEQN